MNLTDSIILEFNNGYFEIQHKKVSETSGKPYLSDKKTFATLTHLKKHLSSYNIADSVLETAVKTAKLEAGIKAAKQGVKMKDRKNEK